MPRFLRSPWFAFAALVLAFELPTLWLPEPLRPSGEPLVLTGLWLAGAELRFGRALRAATAAIGALLMLHRLDRVGFFVFLGDEPLFYDQLFLVRHLLVLIADLWSAQLAFALAAACVGIALAAWVFSRLLRRLTLPPMARERGALVTGCALALLLAGSWLPPGDAPALRWASSALLADAQRSMHIYASVQRQIGDSPYAPALQRVELKRKPDVYLVLAESYGRAMIEVPELGELWRARVTGMQQRLRDKGWHMASAYSRAPVLGGRSWLAEATLLTGMQVAYQAVFAHMIEGIDRVPNLVRFLDQQGYQTVLLAPSDRERPGVKNANYYGYDRVVRLHDLGYKGRKIGWGIVPDQYSLWHTHEHVLRDSPRPLFFNFHTVSSHAPWKRPPRVFDDYRLLNRGGSAPQLDDEHTSPFTMAKRFLRSTVRFASHGELRADMGKRYAETVLYDLAVLERYLAIELPGDALVIVIGDHQPGFVTRETLSFDSPVHAFARDPALLQELRAQGFQDGLLLGPHDPTAVTHAGFFSLIVRTLARCCGKPQALPAYLRSGVALGS